MLNPQALLTLILLSSFGLIEGQSDENVEGEECNVFLNFTAVGFTTLPKGFIKNKFVTHLTLDNNEITSISSEAFSHVPRLSYLSLANNKLTTLDLHPFSELHDLDTLILNGNCKAPIFVPPVRQRFDSYDDDSFLRMKRSYESDSCSLQFDSHLASLTHLFVEYNNLRELSFTSGLLPRLTHLYLSNNLLHTQRTVFDLSRFVPSLTHLYMQNCGIDEWTASLLPNVTSMYLDNNEIQAICNKYCGGLSLKLIDAKKLEVLSVSRNQISNVYSDSFIDTTNLLTLDLSQNEISEIHEGTFDKLFNLSYLSLERNRIVQFSAVDIFNDLIKLKTLSLGGNNIINTDGELFTNLISLKQLMLNFTEISNVDSLLFSKLTNLEVLSLAGNQLSSIPEGLLSNLSSLIALDLDDNQFTSVDNISLINQRHLTSVSLRNNPLTTITVQWIANIASENLTITIGYT